MRRGFRKPVTALVLRWRGKSLTVPPALVRKFSEALDAYERKHGWADSLRVAEPAFSAKAEYAPLVAWLKQANPALRAGRLKRERAAQAKWRAEQKQRVAREARAMAALVAKHPLPEHVSAADLRRPSDKDRFGYGEVDLGGAGYDSDFEIWYVSQFGWVAPTLAIRGSVRSGYKPRTYGVALKTGALVRVGQGPHVLASFRVYVKRSNVQRLKPVLDRLRQGAVDANDTRDRISTRMARRRTYY